MVESPTDRSLETDLSLGVGTKKKQRVVLSLGRKLGLFFALGAIFISGLLTYGLYRIAVDWLREGIRQRIQDAVAIAAGQLDGDAFATLTDPAQEGNPTYLHLRSELQRIRDAGTGYRFVYTLRRAPDGKILFVVDAEEDPAELSHLGQHYDDAGPTLRASLDERDQAVVEEDFYTDKWGTWLTGYAPVLRADGTREVVLGMDIEAATVIARERRFLWTALAVFSITLPFSVLAGGLLGRRLAKPLRALTQGAERISGGDLDHVVQIDSKDEIGELASSFNTMTRRLSNSLEALRKSEEELTRHRDNLEIIVRERTQSLTIANERMNENLVSAARVQQAFLPQQPPDIPGLHFAWNFTPCDELAGDMLDICKIDSHRVGIWVADVCGHGVAAALISVTLSRLLSSLSESAQGAALHNPNQPPSRVIPPPDVASFLNESFSWDPEDVRFFTFLYGVLDVRTGGLRYVSAGHPGPLLVPAEGEPRILPKSPPAVGLLPEPVFVEHQATLKAGDRLYLYTDGITETMNQAGEEFGIERLLQSLGADRDLALEEGIEHLMSKLSAWRDTEQLEDDLSLVAVEMAK